MTPEEIGMAGFGISLRDSDFVHIKTPEELTEKTMAAVVQGIQMAIRAEREACAQIAYAQHRNAVSATQSGGEWDRCASAIFSAIRKRSTVTLDQPQKTPD